MSHVVCLTVSYVVNVIARLNQLRMSPRKVRLLTGLITGMSIDSALNELRFATKHAADPISKLLKSAVANAEHNFRLKKDNLYVQSAIVNQGPTYKRFMPRAMGRAAQIKKRTSHVVITLSERKINDKNKIKNASVRGTSASDGKS